jgi:RNA polymerase sigma-70 factor (ECF subfamily)
VSASWHPRCFAGWGSFHRSFRHGPAPGDTGRRHARSIDVRGVNDERGADARVADRIRSGDAGALGELYDRYASIALATALRVVGGRDEAEDVVHDAFVAVWRKIDRFDARRGSLRGWLMTVVRNRAIDRVRARRTTVDVDAADELSLLRTGPNPTWEDALGRAAAGDLRAALAELPVEQRRAVELAFFEGYTYREVAELTGVPAGTASGRLRLALTKLRDSLSVTAAAPLSVFDATTREEAHR